MDAEEYIRYQSLVKRSLKLIANVANWRDVLNLKTGLLLANTLAIRRIIEGKNLLFASSVSNAARLVIMQEEFYSELGSF